MNSTIALCEHLAASNLEGPRSGGRALREGAAVRNAMLAVALAQQGTWAARPCSKATPASITPMRATTRASSPTALSATRRPAWTRSPPIWEGWLFLETLYRIYSTAGYNIAHVDVTAQLCAEHNIRYADVERVEAVVNWLETQYPSPAFPSRGKTRRQGRGARLLHRLRRRQARLPGAAGTGADPADADDPPEVLDLMQRVTLIPSHQMTLFGPRITIYTRDGKSYTKQSTGREFMWDFNEEARRIRDVIPGLPIPAAQFEAIIATCRDLDRQDRADKARAVDAEDGVR